MNEQDCSLKINQWKIFFLFLKMNKRHLTFLSLDYEILKNCDNTEFFKLFG